MDGIHGISSWRWIFILEGLFNFFVALCTFIVLPPFPAESNFLSSEEKQHLLDRLFLERGNEVEQSRNQPWVSYLFDWYTWINIMMYFGADMSAAAISQFSPTILSECEFFSSYKSRSTVCSILPTFCMGCHLTTHFSSGLDSQ